MATASAVVGTTSSLSCRRGGNFYRVATVPSSVRFAARLSSRFEGRHPVSVRKPKAIPPATSAGAAAAAAAAASYLRAREARRRRASAQTLIAVATATEKGEMRIAAVTGNLTKEQVADYERNGFLVIEDFASADELLALRQRMEELVEQFDPREVSVFSSRNQTKTCNDYFFNSAGNVSFFFEEGAFDDEGNLKGPKSLSINKVGHALHDVDPVFRSFSRSPKMAAVLRSIGYKKATPIQSMYIFKQPGIGGEVVPHQDSTFLYTEPLSTIGLWVALEDANKENGCLWATPGSHKTEPVHRRFIREPGSDTASFDNPHAQFDLSRLVPLEVKAGSLVLLHGTLVHMSHENKSPNSRHAYSVHFIEGEGSKWALNNWLQLDRPFEPL